MFPCRYGLFIYLTYLHGFTIKLIQESPDQIFIFSVIEKLRKTNSTLTGSIGQNKMGILVIQFSSAMLVSVAYFIGHIVYPACLGEYPDGYSSIWISCKSALYITTQYFIDCNLYNAVPGNILTAML